MTTQIHPSAIVAKGAELGRDVRIGPYCIVEDNTKIGDGTVLRASVHVCNYTEIGPNCTIHDTPSSAATRWTSPTKAKSAGRSSAPASSAGNT